MRRSNGWIIVIAMKARELSLDDLLERSPRGPLHMLGQRVLLMDAVALGLLRQELISTLGFTAARGVLTRTDTARRRRSSTRSRGTKRESGASQERRSTAFRAW